MIFKQLQLGSLKNFVYLIGCEQEKKAAVIDPAWEEEKIFEALKQLELDLEQIYLTHTHFDHIEAVDRVLSRFSEAKIFVHEKEAPRLIEQKGVIPFGYLKGGERIRLGKLKVEVIHTPGHQPGGVCFLVYGRLFTGDTLFIGRCGRVDFPGGSATDMWQSLSKIKALPPETVIYPGHHYGEVPFRTLSEEVHRNSFLQAKDFAQFQRLCEEKLPKS